MPKARARPSGLGNVCADRRCLRRQRVRAAVSRCGRQRALHRHPRKSEVSDRGKTAVVPTLATELPNNVSAKNEEHTSMDFSDRHIGPTPPTSTRCSPRRASTHSISSWSEHPADHSIRRPARTAPRPERGRGARRPPRTRGAEHRAPLADRAGLLRHAHPDSRICATSSRTRAGTRPTRRIRRRSHRVDSKRS